MVIVHSTMKKFYASPSFRDAAASVYYWMKAGSVDQSDRMPVG